MGTHYSCHMDRQQLKHAAKHLAKNIDDLAKRYPHEGVFLVYSGMSGTSLATAILLHTEAENIGMLYVRKDNEKCHSFTKVEEEIPPGHFPEVCVFVDDFISLGDTLSRCRELVKQSHGASIKYAALSASWTCIDDCKAEHDLDGVFIPPTIKVV